VVREHVKGTTFIVKWEGSRLAQKHPNPSRLTSTMIFT
jgi:hypothetical protein